MRKCSWIEAGSHSTFASCAASAAVTAFRLIHSSCRQRHELDVMVVVMVDVMVDVMLVVVVVVVVMVGWW